MNVRNLDPRFRVIFGLGNICLWSGVSLSLWATDFALHHHAIWNGLRFGLISLAICLNFIAARIRRPCCQ